MSLNEKLMDDYLDIIDEICKWYFGLSHDYAKNYLYAFGIDELDEVIIRFTPPMRYIFNNTHPYLDERLYDEPNYAIHINSWCEYGLYDLIGLTRSYFTKTLQLDETKNIKQKWEELLMKNFTIKNLKNGDFVILRNGTVGAVIVDTNTIVLDNGYFMEISGYNDDLTNKPGLFGRDDNYDIIKIYRGNRSFKQVKGICSGTPIYDRNLIETVEEMTLEQVCEALGKNIKIVKGE